MTPRAPQAAPADESREIAALRSRVAEREAELIALVDESFDALRRLVDWRKVVAEHPLECALGAATLGFLLAYQPEVAGGSARSPVKTLMSWGAESLMAAAATHFTPRPSSGGPV